MWYCRESPSHQLPGQEADLLCFVGMLKYLRSLHSGSHFLDLSKSQLDRRLAAEHFNVDRNGLLIIVDGFDRPNRIFPRTGDNGYHISQLKID